MKPIYFLEKSTLLDYPGKIASIIFNWGCNFRCPFCHNPELVVEPPSPFLMPRNEVISFLKKRVGKIDAVVFTGGEPFANPETIDFVKDVKELGFLIKIDTNGSFPDKLQYLIDNHLVDYIAMDIKNDLLNYLKTIGLEKNSSKQSDSKGYGQSNDQIRCSNNVFENSQSRKLIHDCVDEKENRFNELFDVGKKYNTTQQSTVKQLGESITKNHISVKHDQFSLLEQVKKSISIVMATPQSNYPIDYEFRTTFVPGLHNDETAKGIGELIKGAKIFYAQNFRPGKTLDPLYRKMYGFTDSELKGFADIVSQYVDEVTIR